VYEVADDVVLKVMCWGVRSMRKFQLSNVVSPSVEIEVGGQVVRSKVIKNAARHPNFDDPVLFFDIVSTCSYTHFHLCGVGLYGESTHVCLPEVEKADEW